MVLLLGLGQYIFYFPRISSNRTAERRQQAQLTECTVARNWREVWICLFLQSSSIMSISRPTNIYKIRKWKFLWNFTVNESPEILSVSKESEPVESIESITEGKDRKLKVVKIPQYLKDRKEKYKDTATESIEREINNNNPMMDQKCQHRQV